MKEINSNVLNKRISELEGKDSPGGANLNIAEIGDCRKAVCEALMEYPLHDVVSYLQQYSPTTDLTMSFGDALLHLQTGECVSRKGWNGEGQYLALQRPDEKSAMTLPYIFIKTVQGDLVPWLASQTDMLSADWYLA